MTDQSSPTVLEGLYSALRGTGIRRSREGRWLGGVAHGIAVRFNVDPVLVRVALVVLAIFFGLGITLYLLAWTLLPDEDGSIALERAIRDHDGGSIVLSIIAGISLLAPSGFSDRGGWSVSLLAVVVLFGLWYVSRDGRAVGASSGVTPPPPPPGGFGAPPAPAGQSFPNSPAAPTVATSGATAPGSTWTASPPPPPGATYPPGSTYPPAATYPAPGGVPSGPGVTAPPPPPTARRARRRGGLPLLLVAIGLSILSFQATLLAAGALGLSGDHDLIAWGAVLIALGLVVLGTAVAGWRIGFVGVAATILAAASALGLVSAVNIRPRDGSFGDRTWTPTSVSELRSSYEIAFGTGTLDLRKLPPAAMSGQTISTQVGFGSMRIITPANAAVTVRPDITLGTVSWSDERNDRHSLTTTGDPTTPPIVLGSGPSSLVLNAEVNVGSLDLDRG